MNPMNWLADVVNLTPQRTRQLVFIALGLALVAFGIIYAIGPILVGAVLVLAGSWVLLKSSSMARRFYVKLKRRNPGLFYRIETLRRWRRRRAKAKPKVKMPAASSD